MDQQNLSSMIALLVFLGAPFLFLCMWQSKHPSRLPWKTFPIPCLIVCGGSFAAAFLLGGAIDSTFYALARAFQLDGETSATAARFIVTLIAVVAAAVAGLWVVEKLTPSAQNR